MLFKMNSKFDFFTIFNIAFFSLILFQLLMTNKRENFTYSKISSIPCVDDAVAIIKHIPTLSKRNSFEIETDFIGMGNEAHIQIIASNEGRSYDFYEVEKEALLVTSCHKLEPNIVGNTDLSWRIIFGYIMCLVFLTNFFGTGGEKFFLLTIFFALYFSTIGVKVDFGVNNLYYRYQSDFENTIGPEFLRILFSKQKGFIDQVFNLLIGDILVLVFFGLRRFFERLFSFEEKINKFFD